MLRKRKKTNIEKKPHKTGKTDLNKLLRNKQTVGKEKCAFMLRKHLRLRLL